MSLELCEICSKLNPEYASEWPRRFSKGLATHDVDKNPFTKQCVLCQSFLDVIGPEARKAVVHFNSISLRHEAYEERQGFRIDWVDEENANRSLELYPHTTKSSSIRVIQQDMIDYHLLLNGLYTIVR